MSTIIRPAVAAHLLSASVVPKQPFSEVARRCSWRWRPRIKPAWEVTQVTPCASWMQLPPRPNARREMLLDKPPADHDTAWRAARRETQVVCIALLSALFLLRPSRHMYAPPPTRQSQRQSQSQSRARAEPDSDSARAKCQSQQQQPTGYSLFWTLQGSR
jgi:hypothetical protein